MAAFDGTPSIRLEGDRERALALVPEARVLLGQVMDFAKQAGVPTYSATRRVDDDSTIYALVAGSVSVIQISVDVQYPDTINPEEPETVPAKPSILSGVVFNGTITDNQIGSWAPTENCAKIQKLKRGRQKSKRLAVRPMPDMTEWIAQAPSTLDFSQYVVARSSMWTGAMRKVVQVVMGLGKIKPSAFAAKKSDPVTKFMRDVAQYGVRIPFDYKFLRSHGIYRSEDNRLWLVEISSTKGVIAMPLPIFPNSTTEGFRDAAEAAGDTALLAVIDELGCVPTGGSFPVQDNLTKAIAAGDVLRLMTPSEIAKFYSLSAFSSACGWAFSEDGDEAHNVGYTWPAGDVFQQSYWYQINIQISAVATDRSGGKPVGTGSASLVLQNSGYLYSPYTKNSFIAVKYHEPLIGGLMSHSAKPLERRDIPYVCDAPVFVGFMGGDLKVARYFRPVSPEPYSSSSDDRNNGECLLGGEWSWSSSSGTRSLPEMPYTNDIDPRAVLKSAHSSSTLRSECLGYMPPGFSDFLQAPDYCYVSRNMAWRQTTSTESFSGEYMGGCFIVPDGTREAYYYIQGHYYASHSGGTSVQYVTVQDPNVYYGWRNIGVYYVAPWPSGFGCKTSTCGGKHSERRIMCHVNEGSGYSGEWAVGGSSDCRSYADNGEWADQCQDIKSLCSGTWPAMRNTNTGWDLGRDFSGSWTMYTNGFGGAATGAITEGQFDYAMTPSPDPETDMIQTLAAQHSAIGDCVLYQKGLQGEVVVNGYSPETITEEDGMPAFIGVNE